MSSTSTNISSCTVFKMKTNVQISSENSLNEDDIHNYVEQLRFLMLEDCKLREFRTDSVFLLKFLHCTEFNLPLTLTKIRNYYDFCFEHPKWFAHIAPLEVRDKIERNDKMIMSERDLNGRGIFIVKVGRIRTDNSSPQEETQLIELWIEQLTGDIKTQSSGVSVILDMKDYSLKLFKWLTPSNIRIAVKRIELYPIKNLVIHVVNTSYLLNASVKLIWPFMNKALKETFCFHYDSWESLHEHISPETLPSEYGGTGKDLDFQAANQHLFNWSSEIGERLIKQNLSKKV
ncbi:hypothetical protein FQA39_LY11134 [Lamprigera yunnana]|nr:hypothetical protein FQA39_LY11134 [Lamprigera yunnana]